jgi:hypothetical protein
MRNKTNFYAITWLAGQLENQDARQVWYGIVNIIIDILQLAFNFYIYTFTQLLKYVSVTEIV